MVVVEGGVQPDYFLHKMQLWEVNCIINGVCNKKQLAWETTRMQGFWTIRAFGGKIESPQALLPLRSDRTEAEMPSEEEIEELRNMLRKESKGNR